MQFFDSSEYGIAQNRNEAKAKKIERKPQNRNNERVHLLSKKHQNERNCHSASKRFVRENSESKLFVRDNGALKTERDNRNSQMEIFQTVKSLGETEKSQCLSERQIRVSYYGTLNDKENRQNAHSQILKLQMQNDSLSSQITTLRTALRSQKNISQNLLSELKEKGNEMKHKNTENEKMKQQIFQINKQISEMKQQISKMETEIAIKNKEIENKNEQIVSKNKEIVKMNEQIMKKDLQMQTKNKIIETLRKENQMKEKQIEMKNEQISFKSEQIETKNKEIQAKNKQIQTKNTEIQTKDKEIEKMSELRKNFEHDVSEILRSGSSEVSICFDRNEAMSFEESKSSAVNDSATETENIRIANALKERLQRQQIEMVMLKRAKEEATGKLLLKEREVRALSLRLKVETKKCDCECATNNPKKLKSKQCDLNESDVTLDFSIESTN